MKTDSRFQQLIATKYQVYNSLFLTLPFEGVADVGMLLPLLSKYCLDEFNNNKTPKEIIDDFL